MERSKYFKKFMNENIKKYPKLEALVNSKKLKFNKLNY